ncbi:hypothetical protein RLI75_08935, partial [Streptococcus pneumoniae]|nr:hypothetical protein [Streptococcus pneumoniae]
MDALTRRQFDRSMFAKERTLAIRVGEYASRDIKEASFEYGYIKGDTYKPGGTCAGSGKITFTSIITTFNKLDTLHPEIGLLVGDTYQWVKMGEYFINDIEIDRNRNTTTLELMDGMFKLNREYVTDLHFPAEVREVIQEICLKTGIELANDYFGISAMRYHIEQVPEGKKLSFRDMLSAMTQMIGMSCFFNREGKMEIRDLTESNITINADSYFLHGLTKSEIEYQIAGITCKTDKKSLTVGMKTGRSLELDNVFMTQSALNDLYYKLKNLTYYPYNLNYQGHLLLEVGQWVTIQTNKKETFKVPVLSQSFTFKGGLRGRISADSKAGNDTQYSYEGTITKQIKQQDGIEAKIQAQIEAADKDFDQKVDKIKKDFNDQVELAKARAEEVKRELSDTINQRFNSFDNGPLKETKRKAEEALRNAGASTLLAQEAKRIGLDSVARLEAFKSQTTSAQTALSGDLDALKRTIVNDIRPKQAQAEAEIAKQVEALSRTKNELAGASTLLAQEAKRIELDSVARLEAFKSQTTSAQTALSGDLDALKRTIVNDIRPKQAQAEAEIAKQVEALSRTKNELAGASTLLAQEAKRIELDSVARLEAFKSQTTSAQTALSGDLDVLKQTIANDIRPKQAQAEAEIAKQVEALVQTKKELSGASTLLAQEAKRIELDSVARLEAFKSQTTSAQTALSGDLDVLKRTIANDIRPKQAQAEAEIAKQVEVLSRTKNELSGVKSAQATYEETTTRRLSELTNLANGKASKSELTQTAEELASRIASVQAGSSRNYFRNSRSRTFTTGGQAVYDYRTFIVPDFWKNSDRFKRDYVRISFDVTFPVALVNDMPAMVHFSAHPWYAYRNLIFKGGTVERQHFEFTIDLSSSSETYQTNNVFIRFGTNYGFPAGLQVVIENAMLSVGNYFPAYQPAYEDQEDRVSVVESNFKQRADSLDAGVSRLTEGLRTKADISSLNVTAENIRQSVKSLETDTQNKLNQKLSQAEFEVRAGSIRQEILNATKDKASKSELTQTAEELSSKIASV